jgi:hypothetical protein
LKPKDNGKREFLKMEGLVFPIGMIIAGGALFMKWQRILREQKSAKAIFWMAVSLTAGACGLVTLLGALCNGS